MDSENNYFIAEDGTILHAQAGKATYDERARTLTIELSKPVKTSDGVRTDSYTVEFKNIDLAGDVYTNKVASDDGGLVIDTILIQKVGVNPPHLMGIHKRNARRGANKDADAGERADSEARNKRMFKKLGALAGDGGPLTDSLSGGAANPDMDAAFEDSSGIKDGRASSEKPGLRSSGDDSKAGGIDDLGATSADKNTATAESGEDAPIPPLNHKPTGQVASFSLNNLVIIPAEDSDSVE